MVKIQSSVIIILCILSFSLLLTGCEGDRKFIYQDKRYSLDQCIANTFCELPMFSNTTVLINLSDVNDTFIVRIL
jgi:hypothetical protein